MRAWGRMAEIRVGQGPKPPEALLLIGLPRARLRRGHLGISLFPRKQPNLFGTKLPHRATVTRLLEDPAIGRDQNAWA